jgi:hypothetical protein
VRAQSKVDLKVLKLEDSARTITLSANDLAKFFEDKEIMDEYGEALVKGKKEESHYAKNKGEELKVLLKRGYVALLDLILKLKKANLWDEQFDKYVAKLITGGDIKTQLEKYGGARKLLESGLNLNSAAGLKKDIDDHANLFIWQTAKTKETCR